jgi:hypothetical protein
MKDLEVVFQDLSIDTNNGLYYTNNELWKTDLQFPSRVKRFLEHSHSDAFFCFDNKPLILFFENPKDKKYLHQTIWNFNESPIVIIIENGSIEIFNGFKLSESEINKGFLDKIGNEKKLNDFTYFQLVTGKTWETYQNELNYKNRVDYKLLSNIREARTLILKKFSKIDGDETKKQNNKIANALLGKIIFVRYLIDRKVILNFEGKTKTWTNDEFCHLLKQPIVVKRFFRYLADPQEGFNGDLFPLSENEFEQIPSDAYAILIDLLQSKEIASGQLSLFDLYDFSIIPIEFISNVYESFIGLENQAKKGAYYTPLFLVDYILSETVEKHLKQNNNCKVLDPACGSGVFLVETLRKLIEQYIANNKAVTENAVQFKAAINDIVRKNIFGIDKDESAVQVAVFSIYLTLLDYMNPPEIATFKFPSLLNTNFFCDDFFNQEATFNSELKNIGFSFIIGNPPWMRGKNEKKKTKKEPLYVKYIENRKKLEKGQREPFIDIGNKEIAQAFLLRSSDFSDENTKCSLIVTSKVLYNLQSVKFRKYFLHRYLIERVFELALVRREVFDKSNDKAIAPACLLFFKDAKDGKTDSNLIEHIALKPSRFFSLFKVFTINRHDIQIVQQNRLKEFDWFWKVLVYGSYLDFNFIKRLKESYPTIREIVTKDSNFIIGQGIMVGGGDKNDASELVGKPYIDTKSDIRQFWINPENKKIWQQKIVHRVRNKKLYKAPMLLISGGNNNKLKCISALCVADSVFKSSLTAIKICNTDTLRQLSGILNSSFFSYFNIQTFSSTGIEREESHDEEKLNIPFPETSTIHIIVREIEKLVNENYSQTFVESNIQNNLKKKLDDLDNSIYDAFSISKEEKYLLEYTNKIMIPVQMEHKDFEKHMLPCTNRDPILQDYANLFFEQFNNSFDSVGKKFTIEIWHTNQIIGMFFKVVSVQEYKQDVIWINKQNDKTGILQTIISLGTTKITDQLFVRKDVRGFQKDYFYVFKPNEKRLWHRAVGYLDVYEFRDAILKAGRDQHE